MKNHWTLIIIFLASCSSKNPANESVLLKPKDFLAKMASSPGAMILDVRTPEEVATGSIKGALNFDFKSPEFKLLISGMDKTQPYFIYCAKGSRSGKTADLMSDMNFQKVYTLDGGIEAWKKEGLPVKVVR